MNDLLGIIGAAAPAKTQGPATAATGADEQAAAELAGAGLFAGLVARQMPGQVAALPGLSAPPPTGGPPGDAQVAAVTGTTVTTASVPVPPEILSPATPPTAEAAGPAPFPVTTAAPPVAGPVATIPTASVAAPVPLAVTTPEQGPLPLPTAAPDTGSTPKRPLTTAAPQPAAAPADMAPADMAPADRAPVKPTVTAVTAPPVRREAPVPGPVSAPVPSKVEGTHTGIPENATVMAAPYEPADTETAPQQAQPPTPAAPAAAAAEAPLPPTDPSAAATVAPATPGVSSLPAAATEHATQLAARADGAPAAAGAGIRAQVLTAALPGPGFRGDQTMSLQLDPEDLGRVEVRLQARGEHLAVTFTATGPEAEQALREGARELAETIAARSGRFQQVEVRVDIRESDERSEGRQEARREETARGSGRDEGRGQRRPGQEPRTTAEAWAELARGG